MLGSLLGGSSVIGGKGKAKLHLRLISQVAYDWNLHHENLSWAEVLKAQIKVKPGLSVYLDPSKDLGFGLPSVQ